MKEFAPAFERNKDPILAVLREILPQSGLVLEVGSGTGQHAAYFAAEFQGVTWQPTDLPESHASIRAWGASAKLANLNPPLVLDLLTDEWPLASADAIVCINTVQIVAWRGVEQLFARASDTLSPGGVLYVYGPYRYRDRPFEASNAQFDRWLKDRDPDSGVRDFESVNALAEKAGLRLDGDRGMPANNRSIWWRRPIPTESAGRIG